MDETIWYQGKPAGQIRAEQDGLYWKLDAQCEPRGSGILRIYGADRFRSEPFGVPVPGDGGLVLHRRLSRHACPHLPEHWLLGREAEGFRPWRGSVDGQEIADAMICPGDPADCTLLAVPAEPEPVPLAEYVSVMEPRRLADRNYLVLELRNGLPVLPAPEAEQEDAESPDQSS